MEKDDDRVKIALTYEKVIGIDRWKDAHEREDEERLDTIKAFISEESAEIKKKLDELWDARNVQIGGSRMWKMIMDNALKYGGVLLIVFAIGMIAGGGSSTVAKLIGELAK